MHFTGWIGERLLGLLRLLTGHLIDGSSMFRFWEDFDKGYLS